MRLSLVAILSACSIVACSDGRESSSGQGPRIALTESEAGVARQGMNFQVRGAASVEARSVRVTVSGLTSDGTVGDEAPDYIVLQLIEGARGEPRGTVALYFPPGVASGAYDLVDSLDFLGGETAAPGAGYVHREGGANSFFSLAAPGEISVQRRGESLSGSFRFDAVKIADPEFAVEISGEFRDVVLKSTIGN